VETVRIILPPNFWVVVLAGLALAPALTAMVILHVVFGAVGGWLVGLFFGETILGTLSRFGVDIEGLSMWQLGATLAFVGAFFRAHQTVKNNEFPGKAS
jgi:hypothetical protein